MLTTPTTLKDSSPFWNFALVNRDLTEDEITKVTSYFVTQKRKPAFYFEDRDGFSVLLQKLLRAGYTQSAEDSLMFYGDNEIEHAVSDHIKKVQTELDLQIFLEVFDACYQKDDPQNPYGELGEYFLSAKDAWIKNHQSERLEYFVAYKGTATVAVSSLTSYEGIGYISNVGTLRSVRGQGFGKKVTLHCVSQSRKKGNNLHCLITEDNTNPNQFYKSIGFKTKFRAKLMVK